MLRAIALLLLLMCVVKADVKEASTKDCELLDPEHQQALREQLQKDSCLREVEAVEPHEIKRAARLFHRDGFVVVNNALPADETAKLKTTCDDLIEQVMKKDPLKLGNRGPHRWSLSIASKTGHLLHIPEFAHLADLPTLTPILKEIFGNDKYIVRGSRGDFNLPGAVWQGLHADVWKEWLTDTAPTEYSDSGRLNYRDLPVFYVVVNFNVINITALNAPIRQIPMTQHSQQPIPHLDDEPLWMKRSTVCPAAAGSAIIRDPRAWHGGTPNLSNETRCMPNIEYYASWYRYRDHTQQMTTSMPREIYEQLSDFGKKLCREVVAAPGEILETGVKDEAYLLYSEHTECYKKMGLTNQDLEEYARKGRLVQSISYVPGLGVPGLDFEQKSRFYQRKKYADSSAFSEKDEL